MYVKTVVVLLCIHSRHETFGLKRILRHYPSGHRLVNLVAKLLIASYAYFLLSVGSTPNRKGRAPIPRTRKVPVLHVLQPFSETPGACGSRLPLDCLIQSHKLLARLGSADEPAVERIVKHRFVGTPAMRIVVGMLLKTERLADKLQFDGKLYVEVFSLVGGSLVVFPVRREFWVICVLDVCPGIAGIQFLVNALLHKLRSKFVDCIILAFEVYHRTRRAFLADHEQRRYSGIARHLGVVGTESRCDVYYTRTVVGRNIIAGNHAESLLGAFHKTVGINGKHLLGMLGCIFLHPFRTALVKPLDRLHPRHQLHVMHTYKV